MSYSCWRFSARSNDLIMSNLIVLIGVVNLCIDCLLIKLIVNQLAIKQLKKWRKTNETIRSNKKTSRST
jgi:hypothetical protein